MKSSEILREAARIVEMNDLTGDNANWPRFGCFAIFVAKFGMHLPWYDVTESSPAIQDEMRYFRQFRPGKLNRYLGWFDGDAGHRIIALCLAAAIAESEGD